MAKRRNRSAARARFELKRTKGESALLSLVISIDRKRVKWSTREHVNPNDWNRKTGRLTVRARNLAAIELNERLDRYASAAVKLFYDWKLDTVQGLEQYTQAKYKQELSYRVGFEKRPETEADVLDASGFIRFAESLRDHRKDSTEITRGTWKVLNNHVNLLREYADLRHGGRVDFTEVDQLFIEAFKKWLFRSKGHNRRTVHKVLITLRSIANRAAGRKLMTYGPEFRKWTKQAYRKNPQAYLTRLELEQFVAYDLSNRPRLERVRDLFLLGVATAQRWSDYSKLTPANFKPLPGGGYRYEITSQQKTGARAGGPVLSFAVPILERYGYVGNRPFTPPKVSGQKFNDYLKEVAELIIPEATTTVYNDGERLDHEGETVMKYTKLSSHAARRTAVSLLRSLQTPDDQLQRMTGHKNPAELMTYDVRDAETLAVDLSARLETNWTGSKLRVNRTG